MALKKGGTVPEFSRLLILQKLNPHEVAVEIHLTNETINTQGWKFENLDKYYKTFAGRPILCAYRANGGVGDGHNRTIKTDRRTGRKYISFTGATDERIVGTISEDVSDLRIKNIAGVKWLVAKGRLFEFYAKELIDELTLGGKMSVSIEAFLDQMETHEGVDIVTVWEGIGVTILGRGVAPAYKGAQIERLEDLEQRFDEVKLRVASMLDTGDKPHEIRIEGGEFLNTVELKPLNKRQIAELDKRFDGYTVVAAAKSERGVHVCLLSDGGALCTYTLGNLSDAIVNDNISPVATEVPAMLSFGDNIAMSMDVGDITESLRNRVAELSKQVESFASEVKQANETISSMKEAEQTRRMRAAKAVIRTTLSEFNGSNDCEIAESEMAAVEQSVDCGEYAECVDKDGVWNGDAVVRRDVLATCAELLMAEQKRRAQLGKKQYIWQNVSDSAPEKSDAIADLLARKGIVG